MGWMVQRTKKIECFYVQNPHSWGYVFYTLYGLGFLLLIIDFSHLRIAQFQGGIFRGIEPQAEHIRSGIMADDIQELAFFEDPMEIQVAVLYTDVIRLGLKDLVVAWILPGRALFLDIPLTILIIAVLAHCIAGTPWLDSFLIGAVLSPTDPILASAIVSRKVVPLRLTRLLNVESGMNDGLALPVVLALLALITPEPFVPLKWVGEVALGIIVGLIVPG
jgi:hypothetical protein